MQPLEWFRVKIDGRPIPIIISHETLTPALRGAHGVTLGDSRNGRLRGILIDASQPRDHQDWVVSHELLVHGALWETALRRSDKVEESFAMALDGRMYDILLQLGFKWPPRPRGASRLEAWAQKQEKAPPRRK